MPRFRCPYCHGALPPPPWTTTRCRHCARVMASPRGLAPPAVRTQRRKQRERIAREAERQRRSLRPPPGTTLGRKPGTLLLCTLGMAALGAALIGASRQMAQRGRPGDKEETARAELAVLATALGLYAAHVGTYPDHADGGLTALVADPGHAGWAGPYLTVLQPDPWGRPYRYSAATVPPTLFSHGSDPALGAASELHAGPEAFEPDPDLAEAWRRRPARQRRPTVSILDPPADP